MTSEITVDATEITAMGQIKAAGKRYAESLNFQTEGFEIFIIAWPYACIAFQKLTFSNELCF